MGFFLLCLLSESGEVGLLLVLILLDLVVLVLEGLLKPSDLFIVVLLLIGQITLQLVAALADLLTKQHRVDVVVAQIKYPLSNARLLYFKVAFLRAKRLQDIKFEVPEVLDDFRFVVLHLQHLVLESDFNANELVPLLLAFVPLHFNLFELQL